MTTDWHDRWSSSKTPWDVGQSPPILAHLVQTHQLPTGNALVPGCGSGHDVLTLAASNRRVLGIDIVPQAIAQFEKLRDAKSVPLSFAQAQIGDFFSFKTNHPFNMIWDYTFLCAIQPDQRSAWVERCRLLLSPEGQLWTLIFPVNGSDPDHGPPFPMDPHLVQQWLKPHFECLRLERVEQSITSRLGQEWLGVWQPR